MKLKAKSAAFKDMPRNYRDLVNFHPPRPIHDSVDHGNALEIVMALAGHNLTKDQEDYLEIMSESIDKYEHEQLPPPPRGTPRERLKFLVEQAGISASDLGRLLGNRGLGSSLLTGARELSKKHIKILAEHFHVNPGYFI